jgi:uncharacterized protein
LHDIKDFEFTGDEMAGARASRSWLLENGAEPELAELVSENISGISFKGAGTPTLPLTIEGKCVQDADRLDPMGAIGIARLFAYGGTVDRPIFVPTVQAVHHNSTAAYLAHKGTSVNHFYEKLVLLKDGMYTRTGIGNRHTAP